MKILAIEHALSDAVVEDFQIYAKEEARKAWDLHQAGLIRELYFRSDRNEAVLVLECISLEQAQQTLSELPFVREELINFELIALEAYPGFERLFARE